ncbi:MAG: CpsB/CapC family capsule biosynthesis tyrosine phosphatase, partial [Acutalibacteraceae bacterium]
MTDIHTHILFDIDDGAKDFEMSMKMLEAEKQEGAKAVVLTPHFDLKKQDIKEFLSLRSSGAEKLKSTSSLKFLEAAEVRAYPFISKYEHLGSLCIEGTNAILLELPETGFASWIQPMIYSLQLSGFTPVLAHIERYP